MNPNALTQADLHELFYYKDGSLFWKVDRTGVKIGDKAGSLDGKGYGRISVNGKAYRTHRLIFLMFHGWLPDLIDHRDGDKLNNTIDNLRPATRSENNKNKKSGKNTSSKFLGVSWKKGSSKWVANIRIGNKKKHLGLFEDETDAAKAYNSAASVYHGEFANLNKVG